MAALAMALIMASGCGRRERASPASPELAAYADAYFFALYQWRPSEGTMHGSHQYDGLLGDYTALGYERRIDELKRFQGRLEALRKTALDSEGQHEAALFRGLVEAELFELEALERWRHDPLLYLAGSAESLEPLVSLPYSTPSTRLRSAVVRMHASPSVMAALRANLTQPPREASKKAAQVAAELLEYLRGPFETWGIESAGLDAELRAQFQTAHRTAVQSVETTATWLNSTLVPKSGGALSLGAEQLMAWLRHSEFVDLPLERLERLAAENLKAACAAASCPLTASGSGTAHRPQAQEMQAALREARSSLESTRGFLVRQSLVSSPDWRLPVLAPPPVWARSLRPAWLLATGALEPESPAYLFLPPASPSSASPAVLAIRLGWPGEYLRWKRRGDVPGRVRRLYGSRMNREGWSLYAAGMLLEEGYAANDAGLRKAVLREILLEACRFSAVAGIHAKGMSLEQAAALFSGQAGLDAGEAQREAVEAALDPFRLSAALGRLEILRLREDWRLSQGPAYTLGNFHDAFLAEGSVPVAAVRSRLLPTPAAP